VDSPSLVHQDTRYRQDTYCSHVKRYPSANIARRLYHFDPFLSVNQVSTPDKVVTPDPETPLLHAPIPKENRHYVVTVRVPSGPESCISRHRTSKKSSSDLVERLRCNGGNAGIELRSEREMGETMDAASDAARSSGCTSPADQVE